MRFECKGINQLKIKKHVLLRHEFWMDRNKRLLICNEKDVEFYNTFKYGISICCITTDST